MKAKLITVENTFNKKGVKVTIPYTNVERGPLNNADKHYGKRSSMKLRKLLERGDKYK